MFFFFFLPDTLEDMWIYNEDLTSWTRIDIAPTSLKPAKRGNAATWYHPATHTMYIFGGIDHAGKAKNVKKRDPRIIPCIYIILYAHNFAQELTIATYGASI